MSIAQKAKLNISSIVHVSKRPTEIAFKIMHCKL
jgi:hypothetical protein